jgi:pimeloyl-ACP methyl ester carboxylesterase
MKQMLIAALLGLAALVGATTAQADEETVRLPTRPGVTQPFLLLAPPGKPVASVILFSGGNGILARTRGNFLIRTRRKFAAAGFLVAAVDVPSDLPGGFNPNSRSTAAHAQDIAAVIAYLRHKVAAPVWLVGTSMGTISAANAAARLAQGGGPDGLVMTSSIVPSAPPPPPIYALIDVGAIAIPTLFIHNREDACPITPIANVAPLVARFTHAPRKALIVVSGGKPPRSAPCDAKSRHGYFGIEDAVVGDIVRWIKGS